MNEAKRGRRIGALAISAALHLALITLVALHAPMLRMPPESGGPPEAIIPVLLTPKVPAAPHGPPSPIRLHRRPQRFPAPPPIAPLPVPAAPVAKPAAPGPVTIHPAPLPETPKSDLRATLRGSPVGCGNPEAVGLNRAEREYCYGQLGKGAKTASFPGLGLSASKQNAFDATAEAKERRRRELEAPPAAGPDTKGASGPVWHPPPDPHETPQP